MGFQHPAIDVLRDFLPALTDLKNVAVLPLSPFVKLPVHSLDQAGDDPLGHEIIAVLEVQHTCYFRALKLPSGVGISQFVGFYLIFSDFPIILSEYRGGVKLQR